MATIPHGQVGVGSGLDDRQRGVHPRVGLAVSLPTTLSPSAIKAERRGVAGAGPAG